MVTMDDAELEPLVLAAKQNDNRAWRQLLDICQPLLRRSPAALKPQGWLHAPDIDPAEFRAQLEDILYDVVRAYDPSKSASVGAYLLVHHRQRARNYLRGVARRQRHYLRLDGDVLQRVMELPSEDDDSIARHSPYSDDERARLRSALRRLTPRQRTVLARAYWGGQTLRQIAADLKMSDVAARKVKSRAEQALRAAVSTSGVQNETSASPGRSGA